MAVGGFKLRAPLIYEEDDGCLLEEEEEEEEEEEDNVSAALVSYLKHIRGYSFHASAPTAGSVSEEEEEEGEEGGNRRKHKQKNEDTTWEEYVEGKEGGMSSAELLLRFYETERAKRAAAMAASRQNPFELAMAAEEARMDREMTAEAALLEERVMNIEVGRGEEERRREEERKKVLSHVRGVHAQKDKEGEEMLKKAEEEKRRREEVEQRRKVAEEEHKRRVEEERKRQEEAAIHKRHQEEAARAEEAAAVALQEQHEAERKRREAKEAEEEKERKKLAEAEGGGQIVWSPSAKHFATTQLEALVSSRATTAAFLADPSTKRERRTMGKEVQVHVTQISATQDQVAKKIVDISAMMNVGVADPVRHTHLLHTLATKLLAQCECQVAKLPTFVFPLADVSVGVCWRLPALQPLLLALLHERCIFAVPKWYPYSPTAYDSELSWLFRLGYKEEDGSVDEFVGKMNAYVSFYAAFLQSDAAPANAMGEAWTWLARLLNVLPPNRFTASALHSFLKVAGYRLHGTYKTQFRKLLVYVEEIFLAALKSKEDDSAAAAITRLETYLKVQEYTKEPKGRRMPKTDESSLTRA